MYFTKKRIILASIFIPLTVALTVGVIIGKNFLYSIEDTITGALCPPINVETYSEDEEEAAEGLELSKKIVQEGSILVKNDSNTLPLNKSTQSKINVFGHGAVDWIVGGSGSGQVRSESGKSDIWLLNALTNYGIQYNTELISMYNSYQAPLGTVAILNKDSNYTENYYRAFYRLYEPAINDTNYYTAAMLSNAKNFSDTALVVLSRRAGETEDPPREQLKGKTNTIDSSRHYLEISSEEEGLLTYVGANYEHVVVIINSTNTMELDFLKNIPGLDACLIVGATGTRGAAEIPYILYGDGAYPCGRTVDTYPYDFKYNINYGYTGLENVHHYSNTYNDSSVYPVGVSRNAGRKYTPSPSYVDYAENIYLGYKWFETADAEGYWNRSPYNGYDNVVQFPFGYGKTYTTFDWEVTGVSPAAGSAITNETEIKIKVRVTNTGTVAGKDVVEAFVTVPYTPGGIEKAYVNLVGIVKTPEIPAGENREVNLTIKAKDFESYDCYDKNNNGFRGYELEAGTYQLKLMENAHTIKKLTMNGENNVDGIISYTVSSGIQIDRDEVTSNIVKNRFTGEDAEGGISIDGSDSNSNINYISRNNFPNLDGFTAPSDRAMTTNVRQWNIYSTSQGSSWDNATKDIFGNTVSTTAPKWGVNSGSYKLWNSGSVTALGYKLGGDYNDPEWDAVLDSIPLSQAVTLLNSGTVNHAGVDAVGKPSCDDRDGPAQVRSFNGGTGKNPGTGFPCSTVLAQSFSPDLAYKYGLAYGKEMSASGLDGAYAFGCNIHRSPFEGRNYEYLSEDGNLTGILVAKMVKGLQNTGKYCFLKHLVVAESEYEREAMYTWLTEQTLREIYLKAFQIIIQEGDCVGIMSSYNRLGGIWTGGSEHLIEGVLRYEWGFKGAIDTDWSDHPQYMNGAHSIRAGGNLCMSTSMDKNGFSNPSTSSSARLQNRAREATKQVLYMNLHVKYLNQQYNLNPDDGEAIISYSSVASWVWWKPVVDVLQIFVFGITVTAFYFVLRPTPIKNKKNKGGAK